MNSLIFLALHDVGMFLRDKSSLFWLFVAPFMFIFFTGLPGADRPSHKQNPKPVLAVVNNDEGDCATVLIEFLNSALFQIAESTNDEHDDSSMSKRYSAILNIPENFSTSLIQSHNVTLPAEFASSTDDSVRFLVESRLNRAAFIFNSAIVSKASPNSGDDSSIPISPSRLRELLASVPTQHVVNSFPDIHPVPTGFDHSFPGNIVMFLLMNLLIFSATGLSEERRNGILSRLGTLPLSKWQIVGGKVLGRFLLGSLFITFFLIIGQLIFGVRSGQNFAGVVFILLAFCLFASALGMFLAASLRDPEKATGFCVFLSIVLAALGGCWWPIEVVPPWMQDLASFLPTGIAMDSLHGLISFGKPAGSAVRPGVILIILGLVFLLAGFRRLRIAG